jgi:ubiquinone/menaquinone biosynthesis C-methylase UbiE
MVDANNKYTEMQKKVYEEVATEWSPDNRDPVVGSFDKHNAWKDYDDFLFKNIDTSDKFALDFGCGPGRNIVKFANRFKKIDGVDISENNIKNAKIWIEKNNISIPDLYVNNGVDLSCIPENNKYDIIFSTICMQHICVYDIRYSLFQEFYRLLKNGGSICIQMGFGSRVNVSSGYYENNYDALGTNSE